ncbi:hypothetical protein ACFVAV_16140 [Nocardia sp. NPDC057663]|uniref:hypothetical protein n=1 Tax=Nocardia sp. NPDC057663 TaxID=3346201 RepID=UPI00366F6EAC
MRRNTGTAGRAGALLLRKFTGLPRKHTRRNTGTADLTRSLLLRKLPGLPRRHARQLTGSTGRRRLTAVAIGTARLIRPAVSGGRCSGMIRRYGPKPGRRLLTGTVSGLTRRHTLPRSGLTRAALLVEAGIRGPVRRLRSTSRLTRTWCGDVPLVLPGRHPTLPRRGGCLALCRSVATIVVVVPMSGIIVAHHASCTRRNPRIPPVR